MKYKNIAPFGLRMQPNLRSKLEEAAAGKPKWSLNAEIVERLEESLKTRHELGAFSDGELIDELIRRWGRERIFIRIGGEQEDGGAIQDAVKALNKKLTDSGETHHAEEDAAKQRNHNR